MTWPWKFREETMNCETRKRGKLCGREECKPCFERSFASCEKSKYLAEGQENPLLLAKNSHKKFSFVCEECGHSFESNLGNISCFGQFCPYCSNWKLCSSNECDICFKKSFASHKNSAFWCVDKNKKRAREVRANSNKKWLPTRAFCSFSSFSQTEQRKITGKNIQVAGRGRGGRRPR